MGNNQEVYRVFMGGIDASGKTSILYTLATGQIFYSSIPTVGFNQENFKIGNQQITLSEVGGGFMIRRLWRYYLQNTQGLIYVIDLTDGERLNYAIDEMK